MLGAHHRALWVAVVNGALAIGAAAQKPKDKPAPGGKGKPAAAVVEGALGAELDEAVLAYDKDGGGFCGVVLVAAKGKKLLEKGYGPFDAAAQTTMPGDALFDWASVTKQFTAAAALRLIEQSRLKESDLAKLKAKALAANLKKWKNLKLDDPLSRFFPEAPKDKAAVTLRQLLNHTSGIQSGFRNEWKFDARDRESFVKLALGLPMESKPGEKWDYSNSGYALVAAIVERVSGLSFEEYAVDHVFRPAGMKEATFIGYGALDPSKTPNDLGRVPKIDRGVGFTDRPDDFRFAYGNALTWGYRGCGGVVAPTRDLFAWDRALRDPKFLSPASIEELYKVGLNDYALGWEVKKGEGGLRVEHSGGVKGVVAYCLRLIDEDVVVALCCSYAPKDHPARFADRLARLAAKSKG
jgi:CubicO group peptidase (beta-lactamase class C family)